MFRKALFTVLTIAVLLSACAPAVSNPSSAPVSSGAPAAPAGNTVASTGPYLYWDPANEAIIQQFIAQSRYTGMTDDELRQYYLAHNVQLTEVKVSDLLTTLNVAAVYAAPMSWSEPVALGFPSYAQISPLLMVGFGTLVAGYYITTPAYAEKMGRLAEMQQLSLETTVLVPTLTMVAVVEMTWSAEVVAANAQAMLAEATLANSEIHILEGQRAAQRLALLTLVWTSTTQFNQCWYRPPSKGHDEGVVIEFPIISKWGTTIQFLFNATTNSRSTIMYGDGKTAPQGFEIPIPCTDKRASSAFSYMKDLIDTLVDMGRLPFYPQ